MTSHLTTIGTPSLTQASTSRSKPYKLTAKKYACKSGTLPGSKGSKPSPKPTTKAPWVSLWHTLSMISNPSTLCKTGYDKSKPMPHKTSSKSLSLTKLTVTIDVSPMTRVKVLPKLWRWILLSQCQIKQKHPRSLYVHGQVNQRQITHRWNQ